MKKVKCAGKSGKVSPLLPLVLGGLLFGSLALAGALVLGSCATTPEGLQREQQVYEYSTNAYNAFAAVVHAMPPPMGTIFEGVVVGAGLLLGVWLTHLERRFQRATNGSSPPNIPRPGGADPPKEAGAAGPPASGGPPPAG